MHRFRLLCAGFCLLWGCPAMSQPHAMPDSLTAERVVALARAIAPQVRLAESQVMEMRSRLTGARALAPANPTIEGVATRDERFERRTQWELSVPVGLGLGRHARIGVARAELEREERRLADARRGAVGAALAAFYRVVHAERRVALSAERLALAADLRGTAAERHRVGDAPRLEVLLAETEEIRAESDLLAGREALARERIGLAAALGLASAESLRVSGDLADRAFVTRLLETASDAPRADVLAAESEARAARAARALARTAWLPGLAFRLNYGHEAGEPLARPGLAVTMPLFHLGFEDRGIARAREVRARTELERIRHASAAEREALNSIHASATAAADMLDRRALPRVRESESMARESYRAGKLDLPSLLIVRRDLLETRREHLDRLLDAALAGIDLAVARGHFQ